jgi:gamma-glutamyl hercynylcysteine S-oxide synthase
MWQAYQHERRATVLLALCLLNLGLGCYGGNELLAGGGAVGICYFLSLTTRGSVAAPVGNEGAAAAAAPRAIQLAADPPRTDDAEDPVAEIIGQSRYCLLLRKQTAGYLGDLSDEHRQMAIAAFQREMALVPAGEVEVGLGIESPDNPDAAVPPESLPPGSVVHVEPFFLDRCAVTNRQYHEFVAAGGYHEMSLWEPRIWPAMLDLVDQTGHPGPRFWAEGRYRPGEEDLPVVGIGWHEAAAYARWLGKRLPTDAEWVKATSWPVPIDASTLAHRRYPWGDAMDCARANVWASGLGRVVAVHEFAEGASVGGICQLIGNVWEWTDGDYSDWRGAGKLELPTPMKSIRGGAFDTYFDSQANSQFQSGENPLSRRHNIGFRCAISLRDLALARPSPAAAETSAKETAT